MKPRILFMGTPDFAVPCLQWLLDLDYPVVGVVCQPDRPQGRHQTPVAPPVKLLAQQASLVVLQPEKVRVPEFEAGLRTLAPDLIVTAAYGRILPANILAVPRHGCLNVHGSLLPRYRGAAPVQWSIINGDPETGVTIMCMDEGMDTGDILLQRRIPIPEDMDGGQLMAALAALGAAMLPAAIQGYLDGSLLPVAQDHARATAAAIMKRETGAIDWQQPAATIHNLVRGTYPWPGAYAWIGPKRLKIHKTRVSHDPVLAAASRNFQPGTVCASDGEGIHVVCGSGVLDLLEIQPEGGRRLASRECAHNYRPGLSLGGYDHA
jgi:methionyl-tRNA formyltransferase